MDELKRYGRTESIPYFVWAEGRNREAVARRGKGEMGVMMMMKEEMRLRPEAMVARERTTFEDDDERRRLTTDDEEEGVLLGCWDW